MGRVLSAGIYVQNDQVINGNAVAQVLRPMGPPAQGDRLRPGDTRVEV